MVKFTHYVLFLSHGTRMVMHMYGGYVHTADRLHRTDVYTTLYTLTPGAVVTVWGRPALVEGRGRGRSVTDV